MKVFYYKEVWVIRNIYDNQKNIGWNRLKMSMNFKIFFFFWKNVEVSPEIPENKLFRICILLRDLNSANVEKMGWEYQPTM